MIKGDNVCKTACYLTNRKYLISGSDDDEDEEIVDLDGQHPS